MYFYFHSLKEITVAFRKLLKKTCYHQERRGNTIIEKVCVSLLKWLGNKGQVLSASGALLLAVHDL